MFAHALPAITASLSMSESDGPFVVAVSLVASAFGGVVGGTLADRFGRVRMLTFVILGYSVFTALTATSQNLEQLLLWRTLHGFTFGAEWAVGAALLAEYAKPEQRGRTMGFLQSTYAIGWAASTGAYLILFDALNDDQAWRYLFLLGILPALAAFVIRLTTRDRVKTGASGGSPISFPLLFRRDIRRTLDPRHVVRRRRPGDVLLGLHLPADVPDRGARSDRGGHRHLQLDRDCRVLRRLHTGRLHPRRDRPPSRLHLHFLGSAAAIVAFVVIPIDGSFTTYVVSFFLGFFASGQAAGYGSFLAELFPSEMRAAGQGLAYNVGRGLAALGPGFIGITADEIGLGESIVIVGLVAAALAITCCWLLPETRGKVIVRDERAPERERLAGVSG
jgi:MFS family permease